VAATVVGTTDVVSGGRAVVGASRGELVSTAVEVTATLLDLVLVPPWLELAAAPAAPTITTGTAI
jgi:hypothetical protein